MTPAQQKHAAKEFVKEWKAAEGSEDRESRSFWEDLVEDVLGIPRKVLDFERPVHGRKIDVFYEDMGILIEMKGRGISLDKASERSKKAGEETPYQQAKWYADNLVHSLKPRWIITCNFDEFRIHDLEKANPQDDYVSFTLDELPEQLYLLSMFTDKRNSRIEREKQLSVEAAELVGKLYDELSKQYRNIDDDKREQRSLNVLIVRLVFLFYAEDAGLMEKDGFIKYMRKYPQPEQTRQAILTLFKTLDTPYDERDPYLADFINAFPYVNGGLFADEIVVPQFSREARIEIEGASAFNWQRISPTIFGAAFESTLNPETRRSGGMHYTSIENIHKAIDPLFLDDLKAELIEIEGERVERNRNLGLRAFQRKLAGIKIMDPACGSGNFLTESFLALRSLENRVLENLQGDQMALGFDGETDPIKVSINQFYGIEINDFAVSVAKTALWIAEQQMMEQTQEILLQRFDFLPLKSNSNIVEGNALRMDWSDVLPAERCTFIVGNPPFIGYTFQSKDQKEDIASIWVDPEGKAVKGSGKMDYVSCWYYMAAKYMQGTSIACAYVSTNSICQGEQATSVWMPLVRLFNVNIVFAHTSFVWNSEASDQAHVHVVIVGFCIGDSSRLKILYSDGRSTAVENINAYLSASPSVFIESLSKPVSPGVPLMSTGNRPADGGNLIIEEADYDSFVGSDPGSVAYIRPFLGSREFINGLTRWCLWLVGVSEAEIAMHPAIQARVDACRLDRASAPDAGRRKLSETPSLFREQTEGAHDYLVVPKVSSERRRYIPVGYVSREVICSDLLFIVPDGGLYDFGVVTSEAHNAWMRTVCGRLKSDYRYSQKLVYNTFPWPESTAEQRAEIERCAQLVLDARDAHPGKTLAELYDPDKMPSDLLAAHKALDAAVEAAYGVDFNGDEEKIVAHLFKLYAELTQKE